MPPWSKLAQYGDPAPFASEAFFVPEVSNTRLQEERNQQLQPVAMHLTEQSIWSGGLELDQQLTGLFPSVYSRHLKSPSVNLDCLMTFLSFYSHLFWEDKTFFFFIQ